MLRNAPTFLDELQDPDQLGIDADAVARLEIPVCITGGSESPPIFARVIARLLERLPKRHPRDDRRRGARASGDGPERYVEVTTRGIRLAAA